MSPLAAQLWTTHAANPASPIFFAPEWSPPAEVDDVTLEEIDGAYRELLEHGAVRPVTDYVVIVGIGSSSPEPRTAFVLDPKSLGTIRPPTSPSTGPASSSVATALPPFPVPYYLGPSFKRFGTALLWHGSLTAPMPGHLLTDVIPQFLNFAATCKSSGSSLNPLCDRVAADLERSQSEAIAVRNSLGALRPFIKTVIFTGPGTPETYEDWEPVHRKCLGLAEAMLADPEVSSAVANEFVWRVYEMLLLNPGDAALVIRGLEQRAARLGGPQKLLAECVLNRHAPGRRPGIPVLIDSDMSIGLLSAVGEIVSGEAVEPNLDARAASLAFTLFDALTQEHVPQLHPPFDESFAWTLTHQAEALDEARRKCRVHARTLVSDDPLRHALAPAVNDVLAELEEEISAVLKIDRRTWTGLVDKLTESPGLLLSIAGAIGSAAAGLPNIVSASAGATALAALGTSALKAGRERRRTLSDSPWSFIYHLRDGQNRPR